MHCKRLIRLLMALSLTSALILGQVQATEADSGPHLRTSLIPTWTTGVIGERAGQAGLIMTDLNRDGVTDILGCSTSGAFVLNKTEGNNYDTRWHSPMFACSKVAAGDADGDGYQEVFIGTWNGELHILRGTDFQKYGELVLPGRIRYAYQQSLTAARSEQVRFSASDERITGIGVADVDGDGRNEIVASGLDATLVYDGQTLALEWTATGMGGSHLAIGDVDGDGQVEIVVNANPGHILDASRKTEKIAYTGGFGYDMAVGDVDGDRISEIVYAQTRPDRNADLFVYEADKLSARWLEVLHGGSVIAVGDTDRDGVMEIISESGSILALRATDANVLWRLDGTEFRDIGRVTTIATGDADNDGSNEVLVAGGGDIPALFVVNWTNHSIEWRSVDLLGPLSVTAADVDRDGRTEIVVGGASSIGSWPGTFSGGIIRVYDGVTHQTEWTIMPPSAPYGIPQVVTGQLDDDPALEIVAVASLGDKASLVVYDGITHELEWQSQPMDFVVMTPSQVLIASLHNDPVQYIVVGLVGDRVQVFHGTTGIVEWDSGPLHPMGAGVVDMAIGDLDGNSVPDLAVLTAVEVQHVFEVGTWTHKSFEYPFVGLEGGEVAIVRPDPRGAGQLLISWDRNPWLEMTSATDYNFQELWGRSTDSVVRDILVVDLDGDGDEEWVLVGPGHIWSQIGPFHQVEFSANRYLGESYGATTADLDNDGQKELVFAYYGFIQVNRITTSPLNIPITRTYLPALERSLLP